MEDYTESHQSKLLGITSPRVNFEEEKKLTREASCTLAQLLYGYSTILNNYLNRIDPKLPNICNICNHGPHVHHLFNFPGRPTDMNILSLWTDPQRVSEFFQLTLHNKTREPFRRFQYKNDVQVIFRCGMPYLCRRGQ